MAGGDELEAQRILRVYKRLVLLGRARLALAEGRALVGPDCAYHLHHRSQPAKPETRGKRGSRSRRRRRRGGTSGTSTG